MTQVENEYGSFGDDKIYMGAVKDMVIDAGFSGLLFTSDGPQDYMLKGGTLPDVLSVINFGVDQKNSAKSVEREDRAATDVVRAVEFFEEEIK